MSADRSKVCYGLQRPRCSWTYGETLQRGLTALSLHSICIALRPFIDRYGQSLKSTTHELADRSGAIDFIQDATG